MISAETGAVDDHLTIVGCGVHRMVINTILSQKIHSWTYNMRKKKRQFLS